jgi:hypothetical protein
MIDYGGGGWGEGANGGMKDGSWSRFQQKATIGIMFSTSSFLQENNFFQVNEGEFFVIDHCGWMVAEDSC